MTDLALRPQPDRSFLTFRVHGRLYGLDLACIREVSTHVACTPVPQAPPLVRGLTNLRSRIYLVLDAGAALHGIPSECTSASRLVVLHEKVGTQLGLLVDSGGDIVHVPADQIETAAGADAPESSPPAGPVAALCKLEGELMMALEPAVLVASLETTLRGRPAAATVADSAGGART